MKIFRAAALAAAITLSLGTGATQAQTKITVGKIIGGIGLHIPSYIAMDKGFFKEEGLDARWVELQGRPLITAGLTGNLDFVPIPSGGANAVLTANAPLRYIVNQSLKLIDVVNVDDVTRDQHVERELLLIKLKAPPAQLPSLRTLVQEAGGKVLSDEAESFTVELTDSESQINRFIAGAGNFGEVLEVVRSGALAILRGATTLRA